MLKKINVPKKCGGYNSSETIMITDLRNTDFSKFTAP